LHAAAHHPLRRDAATDAEREDRPPGAARPRQMIPYATFTYFGVLLYVAIPSIVVGLVWRARWLLLPAATVAMLAVQYAIPTTVWVDGPTLTTLWLVLGFALGQWAVARTLLLVRERRPGRGTVEQAAFFAAVGLALAPLVAIRLSDLAVGISLAGFVGL